MNSFEQIAEVPVPESTNSYIPVSHGDLVKELIRKSNLYFRSEPITERYELARNNNQLFGSIDYRIGENGTNLTIGFRNSYDKSLSVGLVSGGSVIVCSNLMFLGDIIKLRKHTTNVWVDLPELIDEVIDASMKQYKELRENIDVFKYRTISDHHAASMMGLLYAEKEILTPTQLAIVKKEWYSDQIDFPEKNMWKLYNNCTEALKKSHPSEAMERYTQLHEFMINN